MADYEGSDEGEAGRDREGSTDFGRTNALVRAMRAR